MTERIDNLEYKDSSRPSLAEGVETLFLTGPAEFLCHQICERLKASQPWAKIFGEFIDPYKRMDYPIRALPALRVYIDNYVKDFESWYINGTVVADMIFPAAIRRKELEQIPSTIASALLQQFRRPNFFLSLCESVPGLNELGKKVDVDKALAFEWGDDVVPLCQVLLNFRMNLAEWDEYMESDDRTKDEPFSRPLGDLKRIVTTIDGLRDDGDVEVTLGMDQAISGD